MTQEQNRTEQNYNTKLYHHIALTAITVVAFLIRIYDIENLPLPIFHDEAINASDALNVLQTGDYKFFYPNNGGREGLFFNLIALSFKLFGVGVWQLKLPSIIFGTLTVLGTWFLARELFIDRPRMALAAAWFTAVSFWGLIFSRIAFRGVMVAPILAFAIALFLRGVRLRSWKPFALGGLIFGLGFHSYIAYRIAPAVLVALIALLWVAQGKEFLRQQRRGIAIYLLCACMTAAPMAWVAYTQPKNFNNRASSISIFSNKGEWINGSFATTLRHNITTQFLQFNVMGDQNWRHNYSKAPQLEPLTGMLFLGGLALSLFVFLRSLWRRIVQRMYDAHLVPHGLLLAWFVAMQAPAFLALECSVCIPHALRSIGVIPAIFIFCALAFNTIFEYSARLIKQRYKKTLLGIAFVFFVYTFVFTAHEYFVTWKNAPERFERFRTWQSLVAVLTRRQTNLANLLIEKGANIHWNSAEGRTTLLTAMTTERTDVVQFLIEKTDINQPDKAGFTPLMEASRRGLFNTVSLLLKNKADINAAGTDGYFALGIASAAGQTPITKLLIENGANVNQANRGGWTPLLEASNRGFAEIVDLLLEHGADAKATNNTGDTALGRAAIHGYTAVARLLIEKGADVNHANHYGFTPLMEASRHGSIDVSSILLKNGADINAASTDGYFALGVASAAGHAPVVKLLIENGANVNQANNGGWTPLLEASHRGFTEIADLLLKNDANVNATNNNGDTALGRAAIHGHTAVAKLLIEKGSHIDHANRYGFTPLMEAASHGHADIAKLLLDSGANFNTTIKGGATALQLAQTKKHSDVASLLRAAGAQR